MDISWRGRNYPGMSKRPQMPANKRPRHFKPLYVGQWIRALGKRPVDVVRATGINEGYLSQLINGEKKNPSGVILMQIADELRIPLDYLYRQPPAQEFLDQVSEIDPGVLNRLRHRSAG